MRNHFMSLLLLRGNEEPKSPCFGTRPRARISIS
jgi:hypothetical protein